ncbi:MAG: hypothetical protein CMI18_06935 [Opitutaceae bacterium]|nr:hypothetical protein [Opitutaceae bacterium]
MSKENDRSLRFYNEVLGLNHLHYGIWSEDEELTLSNLKNAQQRYEDFLVNRIPEQSRKILDVGCGTSALTQRLLSMGKEVQGLSPDETQKNNFTQNLNVPFHHCRFEDLKTDQTFDCLVMSESAQYIPHEKLFEKSRSRLVPKGHLLICDYFILNNAEGVLAKSGHNLEEFRQQATGHQFELLEEVDITQETARTLDLAMILATKALKGLEIFSEQTRKKHPILTKLVFRILRKKWLKIQREKDLIDSEKFKAQKSYRLLHYQVI